MNRSRSRSCDGKRAHTSKANARNHLIFLLTQGRCLLEVYQCMHCGLWHVGRRTRYRGQR